ncbi:MAG: hypothetical protein ACD_8C00006G0005 [uncultured bacterium]|nr:MAG: hypothetical protein ACD_8C00006G0005 [uncultured bacterium]
MNLHVKKYNKTKNCRQAVRLPKPYKYSNKARICQLILAIAYAKILSKSSSLPFLVLVEK